MKSRTLFIILTCMSTSLTVSAQVPYTFEDSTPAAAAQVNANFGAHTTQINQLQAQIEQLQAQMQAVISPLSMARVAGIYQLFEIGIEVNAYNPGFGIGGSSNRGTVTLNENGTGTFTGTDTYRALNFSPWPINVRNASGEGTVTVFQTQIQLNPQTELDESNFTWTLEGNAITVTVPPEDPEDTSDVLTFYAASPRILVGGGTDEGESNLTIIVRQ